MKETPKVRRIPAYVRNPHVMKAAIYVRVSSARVEQLRSLSNQVSAMTRCVYLMQNWTLKDVYLEVASAKTDSYRREFNRLLDDCKKKEIEVVVVKSLSRFGRDSVEVIESIRALVNAGVTIYFMEEDIDVDADYPEWELSIRSAINQAENEHRSENIKMGLRYRAESGNSGLYKKPCYGYVKGADGNLEKDEAQAAVVVRIFDMYLDGKSYSGIIDALAEEHIPSPRGSERWSKKAIETVLTNVKYTGNVEVMKSSPTGNRYVQKDTHAAIIPMEKFAAVQEQIGARAKRKRQMEHVSKTFVEEISWDKPIVSTETDRTQERREISWSEPKPEEE